MSVRSPQKFVFDVPGFFSRGSSAVYSFFGTFMQCREQKSQVTYHKLGTAYSYSMRLVATGSKHTVIICCFITLYLDGSDFFLQILEIRERNET